MNPDQKLSARLDWPSAIGNFLLNYGFFDHLVFEFLKDNLPESDFEKTRKLHFKDRLLRIAKYLKDENRSLEQQTNFKDLMARTDVVRVLRNHLAHGHMLMRFDPESKTKTITVTKC